MSQIENKFVPSNAVWNLGGIGMRKFDNLRNLAIFFAFTIELTQRLENMKKATCFKVAFINGGWQEIRTPDPMRVKHML